MSVSRWHQRAASLPRRVLPVALLVLLVTLPACGTSSTSTKLTCPTKTDTTIPAPQGATSYEVESRYWVRSVFVISVQLSVASNTAGECLQAPGIQAQITTQIKNILNQSSPPVLPVGASLTPYMADGLPWFTITPHTVTLFFELDQGTPPKNDPDGDQLLRQAINALNTFISQGEKPDIPDANGQVIGKMVGASPDWLAGAAQAGDHIGGSPGGPPGMAPGSTISSPSGTNSSTTPIYVLDTAWSAASSPTGPVSCPSGGLQCLPGVQPLNPGVTVPGNLLNSVEMSDLSVFADQPLSGQRDEPYTYTPLPHQTPDFTDVPLNIRDHGVFVSGLIHELAPKAPIRLLRVLNDYGYGDLKTLLFALQTIVCNPDALGFQPASLCQQSPSQKGGGQGIINLSLDFQPPLDCLGLIWNSSTIPHDENPDQPCGSAIPFRNTYAPLDLRLYVPAGLPLADLTREGFTIVAAAGNDSRPLNGQHADADMPAAFCGVIAVAATQAGSSTLADFSNNASISSQGGQHCIQVSDPAHVSLPTGDPQDVQKAQGMDVCSTHPSALVDPVSGRILLANPGVALWDGTSFATAIVSANMQSGGLVSPLNTPGKCS